MTRRSSFFPAGLSLLALLCVPMASKAYAVDTGLQPGSNAPAITLNDQDGKVQTLRSLSGPHGLLILFSRSADWCALCKSQLINLESARHNFEAKGIHVASVTYDSPGILKAFAARRDIHFKLLSDPDSRLFEAFGVRNPDATGYQAQIQMGRCARR
jgi:peroxiredoxin